MPERWTWLHWQRVASKPISNCRLFALSAILTGTVSAQPPALSWIENEEGGLVVVFETTDPLPAGTDWQSALQAWVGRCDSIDDAPPMFARVEVRENTVRLVPRFGLDPSLDYCARVDLGPVSGSAARPLAVETEWRGHASSRTPVSARVYPKLESLPANALRLYVEFSQPVFARQVDEWVELWNRTTGERVSTPFVELPDGLWDPSGQRLTLIFHPGRIKRGVGPNQAMGPPLTPGHDYSLSVHLPDGTSTRFRFRAVAADRIAVDPSRWSLRWLAENELSVRFDEPLERFLVERWVWLESMTGEELLLSADVDTDGRGVRFVLEVPFDRGMMLAIDTRLEDLAGNRVGELFDREMDGTGPSEERPASVARIPVPDHADRR